MSEAEYWVNLSRGGTPLDAGFLLVGSYVLTARHCLGQTILEAEEGDAANVEVEFSSGEVLSGRVHRISAEADLALIDVPKFRKGPVIPRAARARVDEAWKNPYRPTIRHAFLSGVIDALHASYRCEGGDLVEAMQLQCAQDLKGYFGYSGSPIEGISPEGEIKLFGILIEQYPEQFPSSSGSTPASRVLFAVTLSEAFRRFDCFDLGHLIDLLPSSSEDNTARLDENDDKPPTPDEICSDAQSRLEIADATIVMLDSWQKRGLVSEHYITAAKMRVVDHLSGSLS